jgi:hypothetical protein
MPTMSEKSNTLSWAVRAGTVRPHGNGALVLVTDAGAAQLASEEGVHAYPIPAFWEESGSEPTADEILRACEAAGVRSVAIFPPVCAYWSLAFARVVHKLCTVCAIEVLLPEADHRALYGVSWGLAWRADVHPRIPSEDACPWYLQHQPEPIALEECIGRALERSFAAGHDVPLAELALRLLCQGPELYQLRLGWRDEHGRIQQRRLPKHDVYRLRMKARRGILEIGAFLYQNDRIVFCELEDLVVGKSRHLQDFDRTMYCAPR